MNFNNSVKRLNEKMDNNELRDDDESVGDLSYIPVDTGINNRNSESAAMDEDANDDNDGNDKEKYHTNNEMDQEDLPPSNNMETNENETPKKFTL